MAVVDYFRLKDEAEKRGFLYVAPDGTKDGVGNRFWNASEACCDFGRTNVDDSAYLANLIADVKREWNVDAKRVYLAGFSNGGFMSYRMACENSDTIAAIASLAGSMRADGATCTPTEPISVVQIHGTADATIRYDGGQIGSNSYPSAKESVTRWQVANGCGAQPTTSAKKHDLDEALPGNDTDVVLYATCRNATAVALWTIADGAHTPALRPDFATAVLDFFEAHPKR